MSATLAFDGLILPNYSKKLKSQAILQPARDKDFEKKIQTIEETVLLLYSPQTTMCSSLIALSEKKSQQKMTNFFAPEEFFCRLFFLPTIIFTGD